MRPICVTVVLAMAVCACASVAQDTIPFVGCPADGQVGYIAPPHGQPKVVEGHDVPAGSIAYYKGRNAPGVYAPRGWQCRVWYGSSGSSVLVTPTPIDTTDFLPPKIVGPAVEVEERLAGTSGRFNVAIYASRLFPSALASFIERVKNEHVAPDSDFDPGRYAHDSVTILDTLVAAFTTAPNASGLGTANFLGPSRDAIRGVVVFASDSAEPDVSMLRIRLGADMRGVEAALLRLNTACMQASDGC